ncbi:MAG: hypothetical protein QOE85_1697 [Actinomycetota bacterium]|jgi:hypothetical protein|nr:hypothetical protein [Actinomycetota bacterium]
MNDETQSDIDPRFDPAFQRGFDPATPVREHEPAPLPRVAVPTVPVTTPDPVVPAAHEPPPATLDAEDKADASFDSHPGRNPYLLILGVVAVILVAVGVWLFVQSGAQFNSREVRSQGDYMSLDATIHMAPFISLLGAATAIGVVFVFAVKWRRRK